MKGALGVAAQVVREAIPLQPFRESSRQRLMRCEATLGNRAEALRVYHSCREMLRDELGGEPSPVVCLQPHGNQPPQDIGRRRSSLGLPAARRARRR